MSAFAAIKKANGLCGCTDIPPYHPAVADLGDLPEPLAVAVYKIEIVVVLFFRRLGPEKYFASIPAHIKDPSASGKGTSRKTSPDPALIF